MRPLFFSAVLLSSVIAFSKLGAADAATDTSTRTPEQRIERMRQELLKRQRERESQRILSGGTYQPEGGKGPRDPSDKVSRIVMKDFPVGAVAQMYATLLGKEVVVSPQVARIKISASGQDMTRSTAIALIEDAMVRAGVKIERTNDESVALVPSPPVADE